MPGSDKKITTANRNFFLKWLPFNFCDRFCERCEEFQDDCKVYQDEIEFKTRCLIEGKDPNDMKVVFEHVGENLAKTMKMVQEMMERDGVKIAKKDEEEYEKKQAAKKRKIRSYPLYKKSWPLAKKLVDFLENFENFFEQKPWILACVQNEIREISFYCHLVSIKGYRAMDSKIEKEEDKDDFPRSDSMVSAALGYYSLRACQKSLEAILNLMKDTDQLWVFRTQEILKTTKEAEEEFLRAFPDVKKFKNKIIFHGKI